MLKCINCGKEYPEKINTTFCEHCGEDDYLTYLYSTTIPYFGFKPTETLPIFVDSKRIWVKKENANKFGTFKDRKSFFIKFLDKVGKIDLKFALATSGNQAISLANAGICHAENTYLYVSPDISLEKLEYLRIFYDPIIIDRILSTKELIRGENDRWNITNGMDPIGASAIYSLGLELEPFNFDNIIVPFGSGELYSALAVYFRKLRNKNINIIPVTSKSPLATSVRGDFKATKPFLEHFEDNLITLRRVDSNSILKYAHDYKIEYSSALVFKAFERLELTGKTCLILTGAKKW